MRLRLLSIAAALTGTLAAPAPSHAKGPEIFPLEKVRKGQKGYGLTVFEGTKPERFEFEVLGVLKNALPKQDLILVMSNDPKILAVGFARGMSGSPLYIEGKVACAFSYGFPFSRGNIGACTPIEYMIADGKRALQQNGDPRRQLASREEWERYRPLESALAGAILGRDGKDGRRTGNGADTRPGRGRGVPWLLRAPLPTPPPQPAAGGDAAGLVRAGVPLAVSGLGPTAFEQARALFGPYGLEPTQAGGGSGDPNAGPRGFEMGGAIGATLARGDVSMVATGTVSYVDGNQVLAFGHPFFGFGELHMPAVLAEIHRIIPSFNMAFKMSSPLRTLGSMVQDRQSSIVVDTTRQTSMIPVEIRIKGPSGDTERFRSEVLRHRFLTPPLVGMMAANAAQVIAPDVADATVTTQSTVHVKGFEPLRFIDYTYSPDGAGTAIAMARGLRILQPLLFNPFAPVAIERVEIDVSISYRADVTEIEAIRVPDLELPFGERTHVDVVLRPFGGPSYVERIPLRIPERLAGQTVKIEVVPGDAARPDVAPPESLEDVIAALRKSYPANVLVVTVYTPDEGVTLGGKVIPNLPDSAIDTALPATSTRRGNAYRSISRTVVPAKRVVQGRQELVVKIKEKQ